MADFIKRPDRTAFERRMNELKAELKVLQADFNKARDAVESAAPSKGSKDDPWQALLSERDEARKVRDEARKDISGVLGEAKTLESTIQRKLRDLQALRPKSGPKSEAELDQLISRHERQVDSGSMSLVDEKKALREITALRRQRKQFGDADKLQAEIDKDRAEATKLRKSIDDSALKTANKRLDEANSALDAHKAQRQEGRSKLDDLWSVRRAAQEKVRECRSALDKVRTEFNAEQQAFRENVAKQRREREAEEKAAKLAAAKSRKLADAQAKLDAAKEPAFASQIDKAIGVLTYFDPSYATEQEASSSASSSQSLKLGTQRDAHQVENVPETARELGKKPSPGTLSRKQLKHQAQQARNVQSGKPRALQLDPAVIEDLAALNIALPTTAEDVATTKEKIVEKIAYYRANNERVTKERAERAEAEYKKVAAAVENETEDVSVASPNAEPSAPSTPEAENDEIKKNGVEPVSKDTKQTEVA